MAEENIDQQNEEAVKHYVRSLYDEWSKEHPTTTTDPQQHINEQHRLIRETVEPVFGPDIYEAKLTAQDVKDEVRFYRNNPDAVDMEEDIEKSFLAMVQRGTPFSRQDIYDHMVGKLSRTDPGKFSERQKAQLAKAESAADLGSGNGKGRNDISNDDFKALSLEDKEKALTGVTF